MLLRQRYKIPHCFSFQSASGTPLELVATPLEEAAARQARGADSAEEGLFGVLGTIEEQQGVAEAEPNATWFVNAARFINPPGNIARRLLFAAPAPPAIRSKADEAVVGRAESPKAGDAVDDPIGSEDERPGGSEEWSQPRGLKRGPPASAEDKDDESRRIEAASSTGLRDDNEEPPLLPLLRPSKVPKILLFDSGHHVILSLYTPSAVEPSRSFYMDQRALQASPYFEAKLEQARSALPVGGRLELTEHVEEGEVEAAEMLMLRRLLHKKKAALPRSRTPKPSDGLLLTCMHNLACKYRLEPRSLDLLQRGIAEIGGSHRACDR